MHRAVFNEAGFGVMLGKDPFPIEPGVCGEAGGPREGKLGSGAEAQKGTGHRAGGEGSGRAVGV